jgi:hypothetical protein
VLSEVAMLRKREVATSKKSIAEALLRDMQGTAAENLAAVEKLQAREGEDARGRKKRA